MKCVTAMPGHHLVTARLLIRLPAVTLPYNKPGQVVHTHVSLFTKQYNLVLALSPGRLWQYRRRSGF